ncbi:MbnP family protein [Flammeovirga sp. EKP202]|uniref:MbnP family protein n=1 Tax=Flammeovirga sp. EKP202 TaxID=2770592 RepID=UPI00165FF8CD|nr:MbnP family protein [Flammeovirga sp. EKP202]MBD0404247.1 hypothetical protein [Flammeovirga sp. EKP202]
MISLTKIRSLILFIFIANLSTLTSYGKDLKLDFNLLFERQKIALNQPYYSQQHSDSIHFKTVKIYVSNIQIEFEDGSYYDDPTTHHLINFEDKLTTKIRLEDIGKKAVKNLHFLIGTDRITNESTAFDGDLDPVNGMYWAWNTGYINFKLEGEIGSSDHGKNDFTYHIGGFLPPYSTVQRKEFSLLKNDSKLNIGIDLNTILKRKDLKTTNAILIPGKEASDFAKNELYNSIKLIKKDE